MLFVFDSRQAVPSVASFNTNSNDKFRAKHRLRLCHLPPGLRSHCKMGSMTLGSRAGSDQGLAFSLGWTFGDFICLLLSQLFEIAISLAAFPAPLS